MEMTCCRIITSSLKALRGIEQNADFEDISNSKNKVLNAKGRKKEAIPGE
jgi:hypothetical protein